MTIILPNPKASRQIERALELGEVIELRQGIYHIRRVLRFQAPDYYIARVLG